MDDQHGSMAITLSCRDQPGIVRAVADFFYDQGCDIVESHQFGDQESGQFFMRVHLNAGPQSQPVPAIASGSRRSPRSSRCTGSSMTWPSVRSCW